MMEVSRDGRWGCCRSSWACCLDVSAKALLKSSGGLCAAGICFPLASVTLTCQECVWSETRSVKGMVSAVEVVVVALGSVLSAVGSMESTLEEDASIGPALSVVLSASLKSSTGGSPCCWRQAAFSSFLGLGALALPISALFRARCVSDGIFACVLFRVQEGVRSLPGFEIVH